jgi:hypothetical protein
MFAVAYMGRKRRGAAPSNAFALPAKAVRSHLLWYLSMKKLLENTAERASRYLAEINSRRVAPTPEDVARLQELGGPLPQGPSDPAQVLALLDDIGSPQP